MKSNLRKNGILYYKVLYFVLVIIICQNLQGQSRGCLTRIHLLIETNKGFPDVNNFEIYFRIDDSTFRFKNGDSICIDSAHKKECLVFFYYNTRIISCPIKLEYPLDYVLFIRYYPIETIKIADTSDYRSFGFKNNDSRQILYVGENFSTENVLVEIPKYYWNRKELKINELFYGIVRIGADRTYFAFDSKVIYQAL